MAIKIAQLYTNKEAEPDETLAKIQIGRLPVIPDPNMYKNEIGVLIPTIILSTMPPFIGIGWLHLFPLPILF
jgi:hypothetical protein